MSAAKVRRYEFATCQCGCEKVERFHTDTGRYIEYADVAGLVESVETLLFELTVCQTEASDGVIKHARNELARWQS
jgi:hypothetical protein